MHNHIFTIVAKQDIVLIIELQRPAPLTQYDGGPESGVVLPATEIARGLRVLQEACDVRLVRDYFLRTHLHRVVCRLAIVPAAPHRLRVLERQARGLRLLEAGLNLAIFLPHTCRPLLHRRLRSLPRRIVRELAAR